MMAKSVDWNGKKECYIVTIEWESPRCCGQDMRYLTTTPYHHKEVWQCRKCSYVDTYIPGMYGEDEIEMTEREYEDFEAMEHQRERLISRYGTDKPQSIRDYWLK